MKFKSISSDLLVTIITLVAAFAAVTTAMAFQDEPSFRFDPYSYPDPYPYPLVRHAVPNGGMASGECDSWANACDLQTAIAIAISGDEVWVAAGTYIPHSSDRTVSFVIKNGISLYGGFARTETAREQRDFENQVTTLSGDLLGDDTDNVVHDEPTRAENSYHVVVGSGTDNSAVLDGFTVTSGNANDDYDFPCNLGCGGGMYNVGGSPTLKNVIFSANAAAYDGGGMYNSGSNPALMNVTFSSNSAGNQGGGIFNVNNSNPTLTNVDIIANTAYEGGGMLNYLSSPTLTNMVFSGNSASLDGGGMWNGEGNPTLTNVTFSDNSASSYGGGMLNAYSSPALLNVTFSGNSAGSQGGGMYNLESTPTLTNVTMTGSSGGGLHGTNSSPTLKNVVIANTLDGGDCGPENEPEEEGSLNAASSHNLIQDEFNACGLINGVNGNIVGSDPLLDLLADNGGLTQTHALLPGSPAIDAGTCTGAPVTDQRGVARPQGAGCDIGAYEYQAPGINVFAGGEIQGAYILESGESQRISYTGLNNGPVVVSGPTDILSSVRVLYKGKSYSEMLGFPADQLTTEYWFPVYDSASINSQLRIGNMGSESTNITVYLGNSEELDSFTLGVDEAVRKNYSGENGGPLRVVSSATNILVSMRLLHGDSYTEELGYPGNQLMNDYWFPWYNSKAFPSELRVANTGDVEANVTVYIEDSVELDTFSLGVGESIRKTYPNTNNGPLRVVSSTSTVLPSIRVLYKGMSYSEMLGLPNSKLTQEYWLPIYDGSSVNSQLRIANVGGEGTIVTVYLSGEELDSFTLDAGDTARKSYVGENGGALRIVSSVGNILVTNRILMTTASFESYYELLVYPDASLASELWFPWYNNSAFPSQLRIAVP